MNRGAWQATVHGVARVRYDLATKPTPQAGHIFLQKVPEILPQPPIPSKYVPQKKKKKIYIYIYIYIHIYVPQPPLPSMFSRSHTVCVY